MPVLLATEVAPMTKKTRVKKQMAEPVLSSACRRGSGFCDVCTDYEIRGESLAETARPSFPGRPRRALWRCEGQ